MEWQSPTTWSWETKDGKYYIEQRGSQFALYVKGDFEGKYNTLDVAKETAAVIARNQ